jgi:octaprenyl-diphosphate synthase
MHALKRYLDSELPIINDYLGRETQKLPRLVRKVAEHVLLAGGKRLRPLLTILFARCVPEQARQTRQDVYPLACAMEFFHSATLLHDDILDDSDLRRGRTTAHLVHGKTETILAGDVLLALGNRLVAEYGDPRLTWRVSEAILRTCSGEVQELDWISHPALSEEHYLEIITGKTAFLIQAACHCGAALTHTDQSTLQAALDYGINLGIAFQLTDDALDYASQASEAGKPVGNDLREGKLTLPLILYLQNLPAGQRDAVLMETTSQVAGSGLSEQRHRDIITQVRARGCVDQTRQRAAQYIQEATKALDNLPPCQERDVLREALEHTLHRSR